MRYLDVFEEVVVIARVADVPYAQREWNRADGSGVSFFRIPYYVGAAAYLKNYLPVRAAIRDLTRNMDALVMRGVSVVNRSLLSSLMKGRPFGVEVIGDPHDVFAPGSVQHPLRPFLRWWLARTLKEQCKTACALAYVTSSTLQKRYPSDHDAFVTSYSSIELPDLALVKHVRQFGPIHSLKIVTVGSLEQMYKGIDVLIDAIAICRSWGKSVELAIVGEGRYQDQLKDQVNQRQLSHVVNFMGQLHTKADMWELFDNAHLFVLPSKAEGLPRAMIEAMARALPCIGTDVGGIPELLSAEDLVPRGDAVALAHKIVEVASGPGRLHKMAEHHLRIAHQYADAVLAPRRRKFLTHLREVTQDWKHSLRISRSELRHEETSLESVL